MTTRTIHTQNTRPVYTLLYTHAYSLHKYPYPITPYSPPVYMRPSAYFILRVLTEIYIPHVPNVPNVPRLYTPYPPVYMRPLAHYILRVLTEIYTPHVPNVPNVQRLNTPSTHHFTRAARQEKKNDL